LQTPHLIRPHSHLFNTCRYLYILTYTLLFFCPIFLTLICSVWWGIHICLRFKEYTSV
jgi:hypothetical protein